MLTNELELTASNGVMLKLLKDSKTHRFLEVKGIAVDKNGKVYEGQAYSEQAYENGFDKTFLDTLKNLFTKT